jgi:hypothetical protein
MTRFGLDSVTVNSLSKLSVKDNFDLARQSKHSFAPTISKAMLSVTNLSNTHGGADKASRSNQDLWICGYDSSVEGSAMARLQKIIGGLRNLTMVDEEAWNTYSQASAAILQTAEDRLDNVPFLFNHPGSNALALKLEEAVLAMGEGVRDTPMSEWHGRGIAIADDGSLAATGQPLRYGGGLITTAKPQWDNRNGTTAVGHTDGTPRAVTKSQRTHGVASAMRLRGGGPNEGPGWGDERNGAGKRPWEGVEGAWGRPEEKGPRAGRRPARGMGAAEAASRA